MDFQRIITAIKKNKWIVLILVLALLLRVIFVYTFPVKWWDETIYANLGEHLSKDFFDYSLSNVGWSDFIPISEGLYSWPNMGFRAPLLPYVLSFFYFFKIDFLIDFLIPVIGTLTVFFVFLLGKKMFSEKTGIYSAFLLALLPIHVFYSGRILTDVFSTFFVILTFFSFWKGYEENNNKYKVIFGMFLALAILSRYTVLWIAPVFLFYFLIKDRNFKFLTDKYLWYSVFLFFFVLIPWFVYSYFSYGNIFGAFIHGFKASTYWGGMQSWYFFFEYWCQMLSITGLIFVFALVYIFYTFYKKHYLNKNILLLLIWIIFFLGMAILMPHKEDRFILPIVPAICILTGYFLAKIDEKLNKKLFIFVFLTILAILLLHVFLIFSTNITKSYNVNAECFKETNNYLKTLDNNVLLINENPTMFYYYTKKPGTYYPTFISEENILHLSNNSNKSVLFVFTRLDSGIEDRVFAELKGILKKDYSLKFSCSIDPEHNFVYG